MTKRLLAIAVAVTTIATLGFASGEEEGTMSEETPLVWMWGVRAVYGDKTPEMIPEANEWVEENFGFHVQIGAVPEGSTADEALQLLIAQGEMPDVIMGASFFTLGDFATQGRLLPLDKYFDDPTNFPVYARTPRSYLAKYVVNGQVMALPGRGWPVDLGRGPVTWHSNTWIQRLDVMEALGIPKTHDDLLENLRAVRDGDFPDLEGNQPEGFAIWIREVAVQNVIYSLKGAGWEVDDQKRLMPPWASVQTREAFAYLNQLSREGLLDPAQFFYDVGKFYGKLKPASLAYAAGGTHLASLMHDTVGALIREHGQDSAIAQEGLAKQHVSLAPPVHDAPGRIYNMQPAPVMISAEAPVPDNVLSYLHWSLTEEGYISASHQSGIRGVHWNFTDGPEIWSLLPEWVGYNAQNPHLDDRPSAISQSTCFTRDLEAGKCKPILAPALIVFSQPSYASVQYLFPLTIQDKASQGFMMGLDGGPAWAPRLGGFQPLWAEVTSPIPSYAQLTEKAPPLEESAIISAQERLTNSVAPLIMADSADEFNRMYDEFIDSAIKLANWKAIYGAKHDRWVEWITANGFDDRDSLLTVTPLPEWKAVMGW